MGAGRQVFGVHSLSLGPSESSPSMSLFHFPSQWVAVQCRSWPLPCLGDALGLMSAHCPPRGQRGEWESTLVGFDALSACNAVSVRSLHPGPGFIERQVFSMFLNKT